MVQNEAHLIPVNIAPDPVSGNTQKDTNTMQGNDTYSFDTIVDRHNTHSSKWDKYKQQDIIPLWVADTDFKVAPVIQRALEDRMEHGVFGYTSTDDQYNQVVADYYQKKIWLPCRCQLGGLGARHSSQLKPCDTQPFNATPTGAYP